MSIRRDQLETDPLRQLYDRIQKLEAQVEELRAARRLEAATIGQGGLTVKGGGTITVTEGGDIRVSGSGGIDADGYIQLRGLDGEAQVYFGPIAYDGVSAGIGWFMDRQNGRRALSMEGSNPNNQFVALWDEQEHIVVSDDAASGQGLARPWLPVAFSPSDFAVWPGTRSASYARILETQVSRQQPYLYVRLRHTTDASGTTGRLRLMASGPGFGPVQLGSPVDVGFVIAYSGIGPLPFPGGFGDECDLWVEAQVTAGSGAVRATVTMAHTRQSP